MDDVTDNRTPEAVLFGIALVVNSFEFFKVVLHAGIEIRSLWAARTINSRGIAEPITRIRRREMGILGWNVFSDIKQQRAISHGPQSTSCGRGFHRQNLPQTLSGSYIPRTGKAWSEYQNRKRILSLLGRQILNIYSILDPANDLEVRLLMRYSITVQALH